MEKARCVFCEIGAGRLKPESVFFEDEKLFVMLDDDWAVKGHSLIVWKTHQRNMSDLSEEDYSHFSSVCRRVEAALLKVLSVDKSVVLKSGGLESHFHFHIYPVHSSAPWEFIKDMFDKKVRYAPKEGEAEGLIQVLRGELGSNGAD